MMVFEKDKTNQNKLMKKFKKNKISHYCPK